MITAQELTAPGLTSHFLGVVSSGYYVGPGHPLHRARTVTRHAFESSPRAVSSEEAMRSGADAHPVALVVEELPALLAAAGSGQYLVLLPDAVGLRQPTLRRVRPDPRAPTNAFVAQRERLAVRTRADRVVEALLERAQTAS